VTRRLSHPAIGRKLKSFSGTDKTVVVFIDFYAKTGYLFEVKGKCLALALLPFFFVPSCNGKLTWSDAEGPGGLGTTPDPGGNTSSIGGSGPATAVGQLDTTFSSDGWAATPIGMAGVARARAIVVDSSGRAIVAGGATFADPNLVVVRYTVDGNLDPTFSSDGIVEVDVGLLTGGGSSSEEGWAIAIDSNGKYVVGGKTNAGESGVSYPFVTRINTNGTVDTDFGSGGISSFSWSGVVDNERLTALILQPDGKILVAGGAVGGDSFVGVARLKATGVLDEDFAQGTVRITFTDAQDVMARSMGLQSGKPLLGGYFQPANTPTPLDDMFLIRFRDNG